MTSAHALPATTAPSGADLWQPCQAALAQEMPPQQFATWIKPLVVREADNGLVLEVANRFKLDWIRTQYLQRISELLQDIAGKPLSVELCIASRASAPAPRLASAAAPSPAHAQPAADGADHLPPQADMAHTAPAGNPTRLDPRRTFESLVEGSATAGQPITTASASDEDGDLLSYSLNNTDGYYSFDPSTGLVTLTQAGAEHVNGRSTWSAST